MRQVNDNTLYTSFVLQRPFSCGMNSISITNVTRYIIMMNYEYKNNSKQTCRYIEDDLGIQENVQYHSC